MILLDQEELFNTGAESILDVINLIIIAVGWGLLVMMTFVAFYYLRMKPQTRARNILFILCMLILLVSTVINISISWQALSDASSIAGGNLYALLDFDQLAQAGQSITLAIGDGAVVWRVWSLLPDATIFYPGEVVPGVGSPLAGISNVASFFINLLATLFIGLKWRGYQRTMKAVFPGRNRPVYKILLLLTESEGFFCAAQLLNIIFTSKIFPETPGFSQAQRVVLAFFIVITEWYPAAVIILVNTNNSPIAETIHYSERARLTTANVLAAAAHRAKLAAEDVSAGGGGGFEEEELPHVEVVVPPAGSGSSSSSSSSGSILGMDGGVGKEREERS
ncbi:hypothetical protein GYMLUDRAFT_245814 [Collybiopsis luxurians FD-317 M1]|uniref:Uncharacterized protein n=1 Tax=Collybiopsis luxurians FD-317 M1 TaxID=944289 RepID=A0A0D0BTH8_9AGAR|nr:hypothetical protein GYMLUDRAFT_245814 [Collybiopsis luxurians FD-317 M1]